MNDFMRRMGFYNITKLKELNQRANSKEISEEADSMKIDLNDVKNGL
eukprot:CAMPEP_0202967426 /NCGR_PEP_ID=MMETSP1396-20130829/12265_1 /ASSEMBLY_ACC=CAM_ASM_000872 /TAXON_ID= /ORGANISM="Pseudokeronopsis sp., Strain Brazil" /LENGTH=46 /DNA_ID= /DNA_START= /DNA_END= /DNA_ORIENTATION=